MVMQFLIYKLSLMEFYELYSIFYFHNSDRRLSQNGTRDTW